MSSCIGASLCRTWNRALLLSPILGALLLWGTALSSPAHGIYGELCEGNEEPGATLVFPYFEVDLEEPQGKTTVISINNADDQPVLTRVVLWTDWGMPVLSFDLYLEANDIQTLNLRQVLEEGILPQTGADLDPQDFPGCSAPLESPDLDTPTLEVLQGQLAGRPHPDSGRCYGSGQTGYPVGYITVDTIRECNDNFYHPKEPGYFDPDTGIGIDRNVLWGDSFYVDPANNAAQGLNALALNATEERDMGYPFYINFDRRSSLPFVYRTRFLSGGEFAGASELLIFNPNPVISEFALSNGGSCDDGPGLIGALSSLRLRSLGEAGGSLPEDRFAWMDWVTGKIAIDDPKLGVKESFGLMDIVLGRLLGFGTPAWVGSGGFVAISMTAEDRFSVLVPGTPTLTLCD